MIFSASVAPESIRLQFSPDFHSRFSTPFRQFGSSVSLFPEASFFVVCSAEKKFLLEFHIRRSARVIISKKLGSLLYYFPEPETTF